MATAELKPLPGGLTPRAKRRLERRAHRPIVEYAEQHLRLVDGPAIGDSGQSVAWRCDSFPLSRAILEACDRPEFAEVCLIGPPQRSKTVLLLAMMAHRLAGGLGAMSSSRET